jgi:hypothetical protein
MSGYSLTDALQSLKEAREQLLKSADALNDQLQDAKLGK